MLLRLAVNLVVRRSASPVAAALPRLVAARPHRSSPLLIPHHRTFHLDTTLWSEKQPIMSDIKTPEVPPAQQQDAPNLQKDPETGEMVSKRSVSRSFPQAIAAGGSNFALTSACTASSRSVSSSARTPRRRQRRCAPPPTQPAFPATHNPWLLKQAAAAPAQPQAKVSAAEAEEELSPNVSDQLTLL